MKSIKKNILKATAAAFAMVSLTGCLQETFPEDGTVTQEQYDEKKDLSTKALVQGMSAYFTGVWSTTSNHAMFGYPAMMITRDYYTQDMCIIGTTNYSHWSSVYNNQYRGDGYLNTQFPWNYYNGFVLSANAVLRAINPNEEEATDVENAYRAQANAFRALLYLDMARMYEYLPTDGTDPIDVSTGNDVTGLTVPIVTEDTDEEECRHNPRATRAEMAEFIKSNLQVAEKYIDLLPADYQSKTLPDMACVYGLYARLYMWLEDYAKAKDYARMAIDASHLNPMDQNAWLDPAKGFNDMSKWMWGIAQTSESYCVQTGIINWVSWMSNQTLFGYTGLATRMFVGIDQMTYNRISDTDFRKLAWVAPQSSPLYQQNQLAAGLNPGYISSYQPLTALKFRPNLGDASDYKTGAASAIPVMRVEEMYFIEAEAAAHINPAEGKALVEEFMQSFRDPNYTCKSDDVVEEIVFQKRIELWGEGQTFFDIKRLDMPVTRGYKGTNHTPRARLNTTRRPAWMNLVIVRTEGNNNEAVLGWNNPDPSDAYEPWEE